jgi:hypothetical protein
MLAAGLTEAEADLAERCARTGRRVADARAWRPWMMLLRAPWCLLLAAVGLPLVLLLVGSIAAPGVVGDAMPVISGVAILAAGLWLANLVASWIVPDVLGVVERSSTVRVERYWSRAVRAVIEVERRLGAGAAAGFDDALVALYDDAARLAEGDALWPTLNGPATSDPELVGLRLQVEARVQELTTAAVRLISPSPPAPGQLPVAWRPTDEEPPEETELAHADDLR